MGRQEPVARARWTPGHRGQLLEALGPHFARGPLSGYPEKSQSSWPPACGRWLRQNLQWRSDKDSVNKAQLHVGWNLKSKAKTPSQRPGKARRSHAPLAPAAELCPEAAHTGDPLEHVPKELRRSAVTGGWPSLHHGRRSREAGGHSSRLSEIPRSIPERGGRSDDREGTNGFMGTGKFRIVARNG